MNAVRSLLHLEESVSTSADTRFVLRYTALSVGVAGLGIFLAEIWRQRACKTARQVAASHTSDTWTFVNTNSSILLSKGCSSVIVISIHSILRLILARAFVPHAEVFKPMPLNVSVVYAVVAHLLAVPFILVVERVTGHVDVFLRSVDRDIIPGEVDDVILDYLISVDATLLQTIKDGVGVLTGLALHAMFESVGTWMLSSTGKAPLFSGAIRTVLMISYATIVTILGVRLSLVWHTHKSQASRKKE
eukprot:c15969_g1_i1.p1 GENE.c15969_g1_i1~~c15969_g1_i1.p1  ORF type:complete len:247 (+),score=45.16 c15969_g1_i1:613-1353(+)